MWPGLGLGKELRRELYTLNLLDFVNQSHHNKKYKEIYILKKKKEEEGSGQIGSQREDICRNPKLTCLQGVQGPVGKLESHTLPKGTAIIQPSQVSPCRDTGPVLPYLYIFSREARNLDLNKLLIFKHRQSTQLLKK